MVIAWWGGESKMGESGQDAQTSNYKMTMFWRCNDVMHSMVTIFTNILLCIESC